jgi:hypothetical protein
MNRRNVLTTLGATALSVGVLFGGTAGSYAQDAATQPEVTQVDAQDPRAAFEAERAQAYDDFVAALAEELGKEDAEVDAAIRAALIQAIDDQLAAGEIDEERAAAAKAVIEVSDAPLMAGFGGRGHGSFKGRGGFEGREGRGHRGHGDRGHGATRGEKRGSRGSDQATNSLPSAPSTTDANASEDAAS